jgi:hypothetical protein
MLTVVLSSLAQFSAQVSLFALDPVRNYSGRSSHIACPKAFRQSLLELYTIHYLAAIKAQAKLGNAHPQLVSSLFQEFLYNCE